LRRAHVRVDVLRKPFPPTGRCLLDILALLSLTALAFVLSYFAWQTAATSWIFQARENTPLATPLAIPQGLWFLGISWFALVAAEQSVMAVLAFARGRVAEAIQIAGPVGVAEDLEEISSSSILLNRTRK
jgi:TRAP-type C4-dicarboxylate transport system permease small subunit